MHIFYALEISGDVCCLDKNESKHCIRVLRMKKGSKVNLIDGKGNLYESVITDPDPERCILTISKTTEKFENRNYRLHIAISPLKNQERFEWFVEKSVEIGIDEITPLICKNTEKHGFKRERLNNLIISAMKQSLKAFKTTLNDPVPFEAFIQHYHQGRKMIAHCNREMERKSIDTFCSGGEPFVIIIGPEGDFSDSEITQAIQHGFLPVHLGKSRLRTETAGIAACLSVYLMNQ